MQAIVKKWGNSLGIRIPALFAKDFSLRNGSKVEIFQEGEKIVIMPKKKSLEQLLSMVTDENLHPAIETGLPTGAEEW